MAFNLLVLLSHVLILAAALMQFQTHTVIGTEPQVPCFYIFGGSQFEVGNANKLITSIKANYRPYGIDFPQGATGRFTNGLNVADFLGQYLGFPYFIPPYETSTNEDTSSGINYSCSGAGIKPESSTNQGDHISFPEQMLSHALAVTKLALKQRNKTFTDEYLGKCIYIVDIGVNDYINNYYMPDKYPTSRIYTPDQYAEVLVKEYSLQLKKLYTLGARKVALFSLGQIGCSPYMLKTYGTNGQPCVKPINDAVKLFDDRLKPLVNDLNRAFPDSRFTFINTTNIFTRGGVPAFSRVPCCKTNSNGLCVKNSTPCSDRDSRFFFDDFHPTEVANKIAATGAYNARSLMDASPYDIKTLAQP